MGRPEQKQHKNNVFLLILFGGALHHFVFAPAAVVAERALAPKDAAAARLSGHVRDGRRGCADGPGGEGASALLPAGGGKGYGFGDLCAAAATTCP